MNTFANNMNMLKSEPRLAASMWKMKCPRCRVGNLFLHKNAWNLKKFDAMPEHCAVCGQSFFPEVGFYYGAMYVSYMISLAIAVPQFFLEWFLFGFNVFGLTISVCATLILLFPYVYRYSRVLWIYVTVPFNRNWLKEKDVL